MPAPYNIERPATNARGHRLESRALPVALDQPHQLVRAELSGLLAAVEQCPRQALLLAVQLDDLLLDGVPGDQPVDRHAAVLANAVGAIGGLGFDRGIPPGIEVNDIVGG